MPQLRTELIKDDFSSLPYITSVAVEEQPIEDTVTIFESRTHSEQDPLLGESESESIIASGESDESLTVVYMSLSESSDKSVQTVQSMVNSLLSSYCYEFADYNSPAVISEHLEEQNELCVFIVPL